MNENKEFEHEIDPDLLAEIEEWEKADHDEPADGVVPCKCSRKIPKNLLN